MYYMGFTYIEAYNIPIWARLWFLRRINKEMERANEAQSNASRAAHANTPDQRMMNGNHRAHVPAKLRRFT